MSSGAPPEILEAGPESLARAAAALRAGQLVGIPTETVYGLAAWAGDEAAIARVFTTKGRPAQHPLIAHVPDLETFEAWSREIPAWAYILAERFWPGPLTLVTSCADFVPRVLTGGLDTVALRVPAHPVTLALLREGELVLAAPSANRFGRVSPTTAAHVAAEFSAAEVPLVLDGGPCAVGVESTIVLATSDKPALLRYGGVPPEEIEDALGLHLPAVALSTATRSPGQHPSHYAPRAAVTLVESHHAAWALAFARRDAGQRVGVLSTAAPASRDGVEWLALPETPAKAAQALFGLLRRADEQELQALIAVVPERSGWGWAIADRLERAAAPR